MAKVSVIVPNYNHSKYLEKRLQSIFNQSYSDYEIILLNDCSTDRSLEIINKYTSHPKIANVVINKANSGSPFLQWNKGIQQSSGEFVWIAESDDYAETIFLEELIKPLEEDKKICISYCQSWRVDEHDHIIQSCSDWLNERWKQNFINSGKRELEEFGIYSHGIFNASSVIFRREVYDKISKDYLNYRFIGDDVLWCEMLQNGDVIYNSNHYNYFRGHQGSTSLKLTREGVRLIEGYRLLYSLKKIKHYRQLTTFEKKLNFLASEWLRFSIKGSADLRVHWRILKIAYKVDKMIFIRLIKIIVMRVLKEINIR